MPYHPDEEPAEPFAKPPTWFEPAARRFRNLVIVVCLFGACAAVVALDYYRRLAENEDIAKVGRMPARSIVYDWKRREIGRLHGENRTLVKKSEVSTYFIDALLAREDSRFYHHGGIDWRGVVRAVLRNLKDREMTQGASTLTMQLARVSYDIREKTLHRKLLEAMLALRIERTYDKNEILIHYMNRVYFGSGIYGVERAAQAYFGKPARDMDLGEAAMLAGIIRGPNRFSPFRNYQQAVVERDTVLDRMFGHRFVTEGEVAAAKGMEVAIMDPAKSFAPQNSYALDVVRRDLELILAQQESEEGGLHIHTSLDLDLQQEAERSLEMRLAEVEARPGYAHPTRAQHLARLAAGEETEPEYLQGAVVVIDNASGGIRVIVGGRDFKESQYNRATMGNRQIGSLFKVFVYSKAYERGLMPGTYVSDNPIQPGEIAWTPGRNWSPSNSDETFQGLLPAETGLVKSRNTMSVRVGEIAGIEPVVALAKQAGFKPPAENSPQLYIGNLGATLQAVTSAYSAFPNEGVRLRPHVITAIEDGRGQMLYKQVTPRVRIMAPAVSWMTTRSLEKVMAPGGTGYSARANGFTAPAGGKTGTTNQYNDAWFVGFTPELSCGVWVGLDQQKRIIDRGYGGTLALPVWTDVMKHAQTSGYTPKSFKSSVTLVRADLCRVSGQLAAPGCKHEQHAYSLDLPQEMLPRTACQIHRRFDLTLPGSSRSPGEEGAGLFDKIRGWFQ